MNFKTTLLAAAIGSLMAMTAEASVVTYTGNTSTGPTYNRVDVDSNGNPVSGSTTGAGVNYNAYSFTVATSGQYSVTTAGAYDTFGTLYANGFNPSSSLTNAVAVNDDLAGIGSSGLSYNLVAGTVYTYVNSAFTASTPGNAESGFFSTSITGLGTILPITVPAAATASSRVLTYSGTTIGGSTYDRADIDGNSTYVVSDTGTDVAYKTFSFTVGTVGTYSFIANGDYDTFLSLYAGAFDPSNALSHLIGLDDDAYNGAYSLQVGPDDGYLSHVSAFAADLTIGTTYTLVTSGYGNDSAGFFSNAIVGPSAIAQVPEPGVLTLMLSGFGLMGITTRRRKSRQA
jgi:hypothetical protein